MAWCLNRHLKTSHENVSRKLGNTERNRTQYENHRIHQQLRTRIYNCTSSIHSISNLCSIR